MFNKIIEYINNIFRKDKITIYLTSSLDKEVSKLNGNIESLNKNMFLLTSTWRLDIYEKELGINNKNKSYEERREIIKAKWAGAGTLTARLIKLTVDSYTNGDVEVEFRQEGVILITFCSVYGIPKDMEAVYRSIEEIKPAHLAVEYIFRYVVWEDIKEYKWKDFKEVSWKDLRDGKGVKVNKKLTNNNN